MRTQFFLLLVIVSCVSAFAGEVIGPPDVAAPKEVAWWQARHKELLARAKEGKIDVLFLGDSITDRWNQAGKEVWEKTCAPMNAANFGIGADRTEHVLWRISNGEIDGLAPKVVVLLIGINNTWSTKGNEIETKGKAIAGGVTAIVKKLQEKLPTSKILLHQVFPMADGIPPVVKVINTEIAKLESKPKVQVIDIGPKLAGADGKVSKEVMDDGLHLTTKGYQIWADALEPVLKELLK